MHTPALSSTTPAVNDSELPVLSPAELVRYSRHLSLPDVGVAGQQRLKAARVLIVGAGGLGSPTALYLACLLYTSDAADE